MALVKQPGISGRDFYESLYASELEQEAEWLRRGAASKVDSIEAFLARHSIIAGTIMELGCGPGAVIRECHRRALANRYIGVDYSADAVNYLRTNAPEIEAIQADIISPDFSMEEKVDVVVLTHVIEHLENPHEFLATMLQKLRFTYLIVEVPLEDLLGARLKNLFKDRRINTSGHVQFFTASSFVDLLATHKLKILDQRRYIPIHGLDTIRFLRAKDGLSRLRFLRMIAGSVLTRVLYPVWSRLYYSHYAVICPGPTPQPSSR
jgi:SAM-dependent methyltransferase